MCSFFCPYLTILKITRIIYHLLLFRFVDEALAADFMSAFQRVLERPEFMNLGLLPVVRTDRMQQEQHL